MGCFSTKELTPEEYKKQINAEHERILLIMHYSTTNLSKEQKNTILEVLRNLMRCYFFETVTEDRLHQQVTIHITNYMKANDNVAIDKNKFIIDTTNKLSKYLSMYQLDVMKHDD
jgi:uncharacterized protein YueI